MAFINIQTEAGMQKNSRRNNKNYENDMEEKST